VRADGPVGPGDAGREARKRARGPGKGRAGTGGPGRPEGTGLGWRFPIKACVRDGLIGLSAIQQPLYTRHVHAALATRPVVTLREVCRRQAISFPTASKGMSALVDVGIVHEITGRRRNRVFAYREYLSLLSEGTEPL